MHSLCGSLVVGTDSHSDGKINHRGGDLSKLYLTHFSLSN